jgi:hypothetical protein
MAQSLSFDYESNEAYEQLVGQDGPFDARYELLVFAASVGYSRGTAAADAPVDSPDQTEDARESKEMRWNYIDQNSRLSVVTASLAYADTGESGAILSVERQIETLVEYGAAGSRILYDEVVKPAGDNLDNLIDFVQEHRDDDRVEKQTGVLEQLEEEISTL